RPRVAAALRHLAAQTQARIVVTSRVLPYRAPGDWKLAGEQVWYERTIQPLAFGQVRTFVGSWYDALATTDPALDQDAATRRTQALIEQLTSNDRLRPLVRSPLLLTMLAILHYNTDEVPRDRARLYNECVQLLLERWEPVRTPGLDRPGLLERLGNLPGVEIDLLRNVIHDLAFLAHNRPPADDGRGFLDGPALEGKLLRFFRNAGSPNPDAALQVFLTVLREDAGLLQERADDHYAFPHLTFQEYLAACYLADQPELARMAYACWCGEDRERWREVLLLLAGRLRQQGTKAVERDGLPWLKLLVGRRVGNHDKGTTQRRRDALLAALSYAELGGRAALANSLIDVESELEAPLCHAIVDLLETPDPAIPTADRIAAARVLADLGDPRFPVVRDAWRAEAFPQTFGSPQSYWCAVLAGIYPIGGWEAGQQPAAIGLPSFWIARFPITVAQYAPFVEQGYGANAERWWTPNGWQWKNERQRTEPYAWNRPPYDGPNQPVIGITWYEATAFCAWLSEQLADALPAGSIVRLPTEAEWEASASYAPNEPPRSYPWGPNTPTSEQAIYDQSGLDAPAPVGCCPAGAAACGALDLAGNMWEMTASSHRKYPDQSNVVEKDFTTNTFDVPWRGGSWAQNSTYVRCGARYGNLPVNVNGYVGFRVVVAPRSH
nr:SUMF1/EgtB/PvdO family nonheme iron enzyme [Chloroflexota bacterium]